MVTSVSVIFFLRRNSMANPNRSLNWRGPGATLETRKQQNKLASEQALEFTKALAAALPKLPFHIADIGSAISELSLTPTVTKPYTDPARKWIADLVNQAADAEGNPTTLAGDVGEFFGSFVGPAGAINKGVQGLKWIAKAPKAVKNRCSYSGWCC